MLERIIGRYFGYGVEGPFRVVLVVMNFHAGWFLGEGWKSGWAPFLMAVVNLVACYMSLNFVTRLVKEREEAKRVATKLAKFVLDRVSDTPTMNQPDGVQ